MIGHTQKKSFNVDYEVRVWWISLMILYRQKSGYNEFLQDIQSREEPFLIGSFYHSYQGITTAKVDCRSWTEVWETW